MRFALRKPVQIEPAIDFIFAPGNPLFHTATERRKRRWRFFLRQWRSNRRRLCGTFREPGWHGRPLRIIQVGCG